MPAEDLDFPVDLVPRQWHEENRITDIAVVFGDFVLKGEMITEGILCKLGNQPMVLVSIAMPMRQDQCRIKIGFDSLEVVLDLGTLKREIAVAEPAYIDLLVKDTLKKCAGAVPGLSFSNSGCAEDNPSYCEVGDLRYETKNRPAAPDLYVIGMGTQTK